MAIELEPKDQIVELGKTEPAIIKEMQGVSLG